MNTQDALNAPQRWGAVAALVLAITAFSGALDPHPALAQGATAAAARPAPDSGDRPHHHHGRRYCYYHRGLHGPGWYRCGYPWRHGYAWYWRAGGHHVH